MKFVETMLADQPWEVVHDIRRLRDLSLAFAPHVTAMLQSFRTRGPRLPRYQAFVTNATPAFTEAVPLIERHWQALDFPIDILAKARKWGRLKCPRRRMNAMVTVVKCLQILLQDVQFPHLLELIAREAS